MRQLNFEDLLFADFVNNNAEAALEELVRGTNKYLFSIAVSFVFDEEIAEDILDKLYIELIITKDTVDLSKFSIVYYMFLILKKMIMDEVYEELR